MKATIVKVGDTVTQNKNIIVNIGVENGFVEVFGIKKPKITSFLMAVPEKEAASLEVGQEMDDFPLEAFAQTERTWIADDGQPVTNVWLHARA